MIVGSKDPEENKIRFRASNRFLQNSSCVFVEYLDCIQLPWYTFLSFFRNNEKVEELFDIKDIKYLSPQALLIYYLNRRYRNPLAGLMKDSSQIPFEKLDEILSEQVNSSEIFFQPELDTNVKGMLLNLLNNKLIQKLIIYYPEENEFVKKDITYKFGSNVEIVFGNIKEALSNTPQDTTYIFSDVMNVLLLEELKKLQFSAVMLPVDYRYNFTNDEKKKYLIDMNYLQSKYVFKCGIYRVAWFLLHWEHPHNKIL